MLVHQEPEPAPRQLNIPTPPSFASVEEELSAAGQPTDGWAWTLTYLEGRPIVDLDDGTRIRVVPGEDAALVTSVDLDTADDSA